MMRLVNPDEKFARLLFDERCMCPLKSDGNHTVTSALDDECTSRWNFVDRAPVKFRHCQTNVLGEYYSRWMIDT